jgi:hypothetical protein
MVKRRGPPSQGPDQDDLNDPQYPCGEPNSARNVHRSPSPPPDLDTTKIDQIIGAKGHANTDV